MNKQCPLCASSRCDRVHAHRQHSLCSRSRSLHDPPQRPCHHGDPHMPPLALLQAHRGARGGRAHGESQTLRSLYSVYRKVTNKNLNQQNVLERYWVNIISPNDQRWEVVEYKYFVTVLKYMFLLSVLYSTTNSDDFLLSTSYMLNTNTCTFYFLHFPNRFVPLV